MKAIDEMLDGPLCSVMKDRCSDATRRKTVPEAHWEPVDASRTDLERVKGAALALAPYAAMMATVFWWQQAELLDSATGFKALIVLALLAGIRMGREGGKCHGR